MYIAWYLQCMHCRMYLCPIPRAHQERQQMDRRRFEAAHMKYACLRMAAEYSEVILPKYVTVESCALHKITPALFSSFEARYAGMYTRNTYPTAVFIIKACV